jgi:hypothetical protein
VILYSIYFQLAYTFGGCFLHLQPLARHFLNNTKLGEAIILALLTRKVEMRLLFALKIKLDLLIMIQIVIFG